MHGTYIKIICTSLSKYGVFFLKRHYWNAIKMCKELKNDN